MATSHAGRPSSLAVSTSSADVADDQRLPTIVLVHGAWADASSWSGVIGQLRDSGATALAPQLHLRSLADDASIVRRTLDAVTGAALLVGHSYDGAVISAAGSHPAARGLVFIAALVPDQAEALGQLVELKPPAPAFADDVIESDAIDDLILRRSVFPDYFASDLSTAQARVLAATQGAISSAVFAEPLADPPAWRTRPSWYQVAADDRVLNPDLQRFMARRAGSTTTTVDSSHASLVSHPRQTTELILSAARSCVR